MVLEERSFEEFQDDCHGGHLGYLNGRILAILNLCHCDASHHILAQSNFLFGRRCHSKNFKIAPWRPSLISEWYKFSNSLTFLLLQCLPSSFGSILPTVWEMSSEVFQDGRHYGHLGYGNRTILAIRVSITLQTLPSSFSSI